mgnify:FL=1
MLTPPVWQAKKVSETGSDNILDITVVFGIPKNPCPVKIVRINQ